MSLQVHAWCSLSNFSSSIPLYLSPINGQEWSSVEFEGSCYCTAAGTFSNWQVILPSAPASGKTITFTLRVNGSDTAAVIAIAGTATVGTYTGSINLADGDKICFRATPTSTPTISMPRMSWSFNGTTAGQSIYGSGGFNGTINTTRTDGGLLFRPEVNVFQSSNFEVVACAGTVTKITGSVSADSGATGSWTYTVSKNGVAQDGTGGTADTRLIFNNTGVVKSATFSMPVSPGDYFTWTVAFTGTPNSHKFINGVRFAATTAGESHFGGVPTSSLSNTNTVYLVCGNGNGSALGNTLTEANAQVNVGLVGFKLKDLYVKFQAGVGAGASVGFALNLRQAGANTTLSASVLNNATAGNDTSGQVTYAPQDLIGFQSVPQNTPTGRFVSWAAVQFQGGGGKGGGGGNSNSGKKGGGGGLNVLNPGGASFVQLGNLGLDVGVTS